MFSVNLPAAIILASCFFAPNDIPLTFHVKTMASTSTREYRKPEVDKNKGVKCRQTRLEKKIDGEEAEFKKLFNHFEITDVEATKMVTGGQIELDMDNTDMGAKNY